MARKPRWTEKSSQDGITQVSLHKWKWFSAYVRQELLDRPDLIFRGHASARWKLESTLDRALKHKKVEDRKALRNHQLDNFFPDLYGASNHCNKAIRITNY